MHEPAASHWITPQDDFITFCGGLSKLSETTWIVQLKNARYVTATIIRNGYVVVSPGLYNLKNDVIRMAMIVE
jgi:hypothetical protein